MCPVKNKGKVLLRVQIKTSPLFFTLQSTPLIKLLPRKEKSPEGEFRKLEFENGGVNLSLKVG